MNKVCGKSFTQWQAEVPIIKDLMALKSCVWINDKRQNCEQANETCELKIDDIVDAQARLMRFAPLIKKQFPQTQVSNGVIESPLSRLRHYENYLREQGIDDFEAFFIKEDCHLPISGSIKARGGIYEVLELAESIALESGQFKMSDDYSLLLSPDFKALFSEYTIVAASTGNLGLSIGIMSAALGFKTVVHMSHDARQWKKEALRNIGVQVVEHDGDYSLAIDEARRGLTDKMHFVDDENSKSLFLGYAVAALRLSNQLQEQGIQVDEDHPLFVYLPCGVGGGPGGITFGLKQVFGDAVHCFFAEPTHSPCMILGLATGLHNDVCTQDFGIDNLTAADGLAVGRASKFVGQLIQPYLDGAYTLEDDVLFRRLKRLKDLENIALEPSALAGFIGIESLNQTQAGKAYLEQFDKEALQQSTHIAWATGGGMVPEEERLTYYEKGQILESQRSH